MTSARFGSGIVTTWPLATRRYHSLGVKVLSSLLVYRGKDESWRLGDSKYLPFGQQVRGSDVLLLHGITTRHCYIFCLDHDCSCLPNFTFTKPCGKGSIPNLFAIRLRNLGCPNDDFPFRWRSKPRQHEWFPMSAETINPLWITVPNDQLWQNQPQSRLPSS
jgi:hypothetical protein